MVISAIMAEVRKKTNSKAQEGSKHQRVLCIDYRTLFYKFSIKAIINSSSKNNKLQLSFLRKLGFYIYTTNLSTPKIDSNRLKTYEIVTILFQVDDNDGKFRFFKEKFLLANINMNTIFEILFLILGNIEINFNDQKLR